MDPVPPSLSSTRRRKQPPTSAYSSPGLLIDPVPPPSSSGLLVDTVPPAVPLHRRIPPSASSCSTAARLPSYRRIAPIPPIRRSPPFSKRLTYLHRLGGDPDGVTSSSLLAGDDGRSDCNEFNSQDASDEIPQLTSSAGDEIQPPLTTSSSSLDPHRAFTTQELWCADLVMWYRSIVLFVAAAVAIYNAHDYPAVMVSEIAGLLCIYMHFWSVHIKWFWLNYPHEGDSSILVFLGCLTIFLYAFVIGMQYSVHAGMCITLLTTLCMAGYLISCIHEYNCTRHRQNLEQPLDSDIHQDEHTLDS